MTALDPARTERVVRQDAVTGTVTLDWVQDSGRHRYDDIDLTMHTVAADRFTIRPDDPLSARAEVAWTVRLARGDWEVETRTRTELTATRDTFELVATLEAFEGDTPVHVERWQRVDPSRPRLTAPGLAAHATGASTPQDSSGGAVANLSHRHGIVQ